MFNNYFTSPINKYDKMHANVINIFLMDKLRKMTVRFYTFKICLVLSESTFELCWVLT